ncbi:MAG: metal ABC transporter permease [Microvirga sp.]|nr:metal ABC transporter permease [Microvirga sp.]
MDVFLAALTLRAGYNAALVATGAALLGFAAGLVGNYLFLRKRALVADALAHATLPGVAIAFLLMVALGGDGRNLVGLLAGSAATAGLGLLAVDWIARRTRLTEDAAIGAVLSAFFGFGVVLMTVIQTLPRGRQAGLESFLLGSTAGMLYLDALVIAGGGAVCVALALLLRRPMTMVSFDPEYARSRGLDLRAVDLAMLGLVMAVTVIGLKLVGLVLIVALLVIPPAAARFWTERGERLPWIAGATGAGAGYIGAALSASAPDLPTGPVIVLICFALFCVSLLFAPERGLLASTLRRRALGRALMRREGLLALAHGRAPTQASRRALLADGLIGPDGAATPAGAAAAAAALRDERRWELARALFDADSAVAGHDGVSPVEAALTADAIAEIDRRLAEA